MWSKISDDFFRNPKIVAVGRDARDLHIVAICHANEHLTDGFIASHYLRRLAADAEIDTVQECVTRLVSGGLWHETEGGWQIHDFLEYNPSREEVLKQREDTARRKSDWKQRNSERRAERQAERVPERVPNGGGTPAPVPGPVPVPISLINPLTPLEGEEVSLPETDLPSSEEKTPTPKTNQGKSETGGDSSAPRRGCRLPEGWTPPADALDGMQNAEEYKKLNLPLVLEEFRDHFTAATGPNAVKLDWVAAWRNWVRRTDPVRFRLPELKTTPPSFPDPQIDPRTETPEELVSAHHKVCMVKYPLYRQMTAMERAAHRAKKREEFPNVEELAQKQLDDWEAEVAQRQVARQIPQRMVA